MTRRRAVEQEGAAEDGPHRRPIVRAADGFTLVELLVVMTVIGVLALGVFAALQNMIVRNRLEGVARQTAMMVYRARSQALKTRKPGIVTANRAEGTITAFVDMNDDLILQEEEDVVLQRLTLPRHVSMEGPDGEPAVFGFTADVGAVFDRDGTLRETGAFRFGDARGNFLEVRVAPRATGRVRIRKYAPQEPPGRDGTRWFTHGQGGRAWSWS